MIGQRKSISHVIACKERKKQTKSLFLNWRTPKNKTDQTEMIRKFLIPLLISTIFFSFIYYISFHFWKDIEQVAVSCSHDLVSCALFRHPKFTFIVQTRSRFSTYKPGMIWNRSVLALDCVRYSLFTKSEGIWLAGRDLVCLSRSQ